MVPPASSDEPARHKKAKKPKSDKEEKKKHGKKNQKRPATEDSPFPDAAERKKRKHKDGHEENRDGKKFKKEGKVVAGEVDSVDGRDAKMKRAMEDTRFAAARTDPRFRPMRKKEGKVALDSRFSSMVTDPRFASSAAPVDKRGRRRKKAARDNPMLYYYLNQEEDGEDGKAKGKEVKEKVAGEEEADEVEDDEEQEEKESSSSDDGEDEDEDDDEYSVGSDIAHYLMARHDDTPMIDKETHRLAVVNMDWDHIKAVDLYMVMTSCLPKGGRVLSVSIYPSEFGLKSMEVETTQGPAALVNVNVDGNDDIHDHDNDNDDDEDIASDEDDEEQEVDSDKENNKLRAYELNRLRYYYAVVVCDSSTTANHLYMTLDGTEFLTSSNVFDLQFIPDSMEFKHPARDVATEAPANYKEPDFETRALQHSRVKLSWDDDEPERKKVLRRKFTDDQLDELDMYLASDDSASDDDNDVDNSGDETRPNGASKRKLTKEERLALLLQGDKSDEEQTGDQDMEITFNTELEDLSKRILERKNTGEKTVWEKHQEKMKEKRKAQRKGVKESDDDYSSADEQEEDDDFFAEELSDEETKPSKSKKQKMKNKDKIKGKGKEKCPEEYLEQQATKEELELLVAADQDTTNGVKGYNLKRKKSKKGKKGKEESVEDKLPDIDLSKDERFSEMTSPLFAIDPTNPQYKRSAPFIRKQAEKLGSRSDKAGTVPPVERSSLGGTLPPEDDGTSQNDYQKPDMASTEKLQILSAVKSLKRNLNSFKHTSMGD